MATNCSKEMYEIANRIATNMTRDGWSSPSRKNIVSTTKVVDLINTIFDEILKELDERGRVHIKDRMMLKKIYTSRKRDRSYIQCIEKREVPK